MTLHKNGLVVGSSPHTRGALVLQSGALVELGIIPAYAGSTMRYTFGHRTELDHPRIRGEHPPAGMESTIFPGSSPHTRGARSRSPARDDRCRIIPAYAGSTRHRAHGRRQDRDHPRIRGEHGGGVAEAIAGYGSSPHTRGAQTTTPHHKRGKRIIPAYAGSTAGDGGSDEGGGDHPRIRGEHRRHLHGMVHGAGSSPHTRGAHTAVLTVAESNRIIPAYAGSTSSPSTPPTMPSDHPRIRGEH